MNQMQMFDSLAIAVVFLDGQLQHACEVLQWCYKLKYFGLFSARWHCDFAVQTSSCDELSWLQAMMCIFSISSVF